MRSPVYPPLRAAIFDLDATRIDSAPDLIFAASRVHVALFAVLSANARA